MVRKLLFLAGAVLVAIAPLHAETFRFVYTKGEKYRILSTVTENILQNGVLTNKADILNRITAVVTDVRGNSGFHEMVFNTSTRNIDSVGPYEWSEDYASEFWRDGRGVYDIAESFFMPVVQGVPTFPEGDVAVGETWAAPAVESHDFRRNFGIESVFRFPITVNYTYLRNEARNGIECAVFAISYTVFYKVPAPSRLTELYPARITASSQQTLWWDRAKKQPYYVEEKFDFIFTLAGGTEVEFIGESHGELIEAQPLDREKVARDIQNEIQKQKIPDASVRADEKGVTITVDNINFAPNSDTLLPAEKEKLARIAQIIKTYPDRDILITGHTAAVGGYTEAQHQELSEDRARAVGDYLLSIGARKPEAMTVKGMGKRAPIADNSSEAGRMKNRRVEITILEN